MQDIDKIDLQKLCIFVSMSIWLTTHLLSIERADWPKLHMFKAHDANVWQREFPVGFPVEVSALNSMLINDVVARIESRCVIKAKRVLLKRSCNFSCVKSSELTDQQDMFF